MPWRNYFSLDDDNDSSVLLLLLLTERDVRWKTRPSNRTYYPDFEINSLH